MKWTGMATWTLVLCGVLTPAALAQRGVGESAGVAQKANLPKVVTLKGTVVKVETGPCENTTGRSFVGTHLLMEDQKGKMLNVHLGPTGIVEFVAKELAEGKKVKVDAFRTKQMKKDHYVACAITCDGRAVTLRDDTLRPAWAGGGWAVDTRGRPGRGAGYARGAGYGRGRGGYGRGAGRGQGWGRGRGGEVYRATAGQCPRFGAWYPVQNTEVKTD